MRMSEHEGAAASFDPLRPRLIRVAYRMLGSVADAEDAVQEAFVRWMGTDRSAVREPEAFLRRTVTRLCLDQLKSARHQRETYIGPWLPDPVLEEEEQEEEEKERGNKVIMKIQLQLQQHQHRQQQQMKPIPM